MYRVAVDTLMKKNGSVEVSTKVTPKLESRIVLPEDIGLGGCYDLWETNHHHS